MKLKFNAINCNNHNYKLSLFLGDGILKTNNDPSCVSSHSALKMLQHKKPTTQSLVIMDNYR